MKLRLLASAVAIPAALASILAVRAYRAESDAYFPPRRPLTTTLAQAALPGARSVVISSASGQFVRGWWAPSRNGAAVILAHGAGGDRASLLSEARALTARGFGVLSFDWLGHGESDGDVAWGDAQREALDALVSWTLQSPSLTQDRLGVYAFSMGAYITVSVVARDPRIRAVALGGIWSDTLDQVDSEFDHWGPLSRIPARWAVNAGGIGAEELQPIRFAAAIAPRPLFVVTGGTDRTAPLHLARRFYEAANEPKSLLVIPEAGHGDYAHHAPDQYPQALVSFFERALVRSSRRARNAPAERQLGGG